jgi:hypothetical protein
MKGEAKSINNFKFLIELSITQFSEFFNLKLIEKFTDFGDKFSQRKEASMLASGCVPGHPEAIQLSWC